MKLQNWNDASPRGTGPSRRSNKPEGSRLVRYAGTAEDLNLKAHWRCVAEHEVGSSVHALEERQIAIGGYSKDRLYSAALTTGGLDGLGGIRASGSCGIAAHEGRNQVEMHSGEIYLR